MPGVTDIRRSCSSVAWMVGQDLLRVASSPTFALHNHNTTPTTHHTYTHIMPRERDEPTAAPDLEEAPDQDQNRDVVDPLIVRSLATPDHYCPDKL